MLAWGILALSGVLEVVWATAMKASDGFRHPGFTALTMVSAGVGFWLLGWAMRDLPQGTAYAVWVGIGAVGSFVVGIVLWNEPASTLRLLSAGMILVGIGGLMLTEVHS